MTLIAPSILSANFGCLNRDLEMINSSNADWIHIDIMDGLFVPNISFGFSVMQSINQIIHKIKDVHLMIKSPERYIQEFSKLGTDILTVHYEESIHLNRILQLIKQFNMKAGVAINPHTSVNLLEDIIIEVDVVLLMSVNPGFSGQKIIANTYMKIEKLKELIIKKKSSSLIEVDGGITVENAQDLIHAGADVLVVGNTIFSSSEPIKVIEQLKQIK